MAFCKECHKEFSPRRKEQKFCGRRCANIYRAREREQAKAQAKLYTVWSCGGGVQSTAIAALIIQGKLPKPDLALMTDCGYEANYTWDHVYNTLIPELKKVGVTLNIVKTVDYTNNDLFDAQGLVTIPAYTQDDSGKIIKFRTHCNRCWKVRPAMNWIREQGVERCVNWIGISADESHRGRGSGKKWIGYRYPLVELGIDRESCIWLIGNHGWPQPERSSCVMCSY